MGYLAIDGFREHHNVQLGDLKTGCGIPFFGTPVILVVHLFSGTVGTTRTGWQSRNNLVKKGRVLCFFPGQGHSEISDSCHSSI